MRISRALTVVALSFTGYACASGGFHPVSFAGETSDAGRAPADGKTIHVVRNTQMKDTILEAKIRARLEAFLLDRGYVVTSPDTAEIYVLATFGYGERVVASTAPIFRAAETRIEVNRAGQVVGKTYLPDRMEYLRLPLMKNSLWLQVLSSDARYYRETGKVRNLWRGESSMAGRPESLATFAPYLLVPDMKYFGKGTKEIITVDVYGKDAVWR